MNEFQFVAQTVQLIQRRHPDIKICIEVPIMGRSVDVALIRGNRTIAIEFKLKNWKQALKQASDYKLACDLSYICLPEGRISDEVISHAREFGVGILVVNTNKEWPFRTIVNAVPSKEKWKSASLTFRDYIINGRSRFS